MLIIRTQVWKFEGLCRLVHSRRECWCELVHVRTLNTSYSIQHYSEDLLLSSLYSRRPRDDRWDTAQSDITLQCSSNGDLILHSSYCWACNDWWPHRFDFAALPSLPLAYFWPWGRKSACSVHSPPLVGHRVTSCSASGKKIIPR